MSTPGKVTTTKAEITLNKQGHVVIRVRENVTFDVEDVHEIQAAKRIHTQDKPHTLLFVPPLYGNITAEARKLSAGAEVNKNAIAKAVVARNLPSRLVSNFFIRFNKPVAPTRVFRTEKAALRWLSMMRTEHAAKIGVPQVENSEF